MGKSSYASSGRPPMEDITQHRWWKLGLTTESGRAPTLSTADTALHWLWMLDAKQVMHVGMRTSVRRMLWSEVRHGAELDEWDVVVSGDDCPSNCANPWHCEKMDAGEYRKWMWDGKRANKQARSGMMPAESSNPRDKMWYDKMDDVMLNVGKAADNDFAVLSRYDESGILKGFYDPAGDVFNWDLKIEGFLYSREQSDVRVEVERLWRDRVAASVSRRKPRR